LSICRGERLCALDFLQISTPGSLRIGTRKQFLDQNLHGLTLSVFRPRGPLTWLDPGAFGTLGVGGGFALGAKLCRPESEVWVIYGDGSLGYSVAEFDTFTRHKVIQ